MIKKKVCLLGAFGVGKTSLVRHFVYSIFDERYHSTIGVKVDKKVVAVGENEVMLMLWDIAGEEEFSQVPKPYVAGAGGCIFVADGTRPETLGVLKGMRKRLGGELGAGVPCVILLNKSDLTANWKITEADQIEFEESGIRCLQTSAKLGTGVEEAFGLLAAQMLSAQQS